MFYLVVSGTAVALKCLTPGGQLTEVKYYQAGDYFGELALLRGEPRAASIKATSSLRCVTLDQAGFKRMLGPLESILQRNASGYQKLLNS